MTKHAKTLSEDRAGVLRWTASIGAVTAESLAHLQEESVASARGRLSSGVRAGLMARHRRLAKLPALYTVTRAGLRAAAIDRVDPCRISAANTLHTTVCAHAAVELQRRYPDQRVAGEHELRRDESRKGAPVVSATVRSLAERGRGLHRPDLVLWPPAAERRRPTVVEIELTIKAPRRLEDICRAWARCRDVAGVVYLAPADVQRALQRAIARTQAAEQIAVLGLDALPLAAAVARLGS